MDNVLQKVSYFFAALITGSSALSINHIALIFGMVLGFATFIVTWVYKQKTLTLLASTALTKVDEPTAP